MRAFEIMEQFSTIIVEAEIPPTSYGYWITADGEIFPVSFWMHDTVAAEHGFNSGFAAMGAGWIRVVCNPREFTFNVEIEPFRPTSRALATLRRAATSSYDEFVLDVAQQGIHKRFNRPGPFLNTIQQYVRRMS
jgi:hypothetical protein